MSDNKKVALTNKQSAFVDILFSDEFMCGNMTIKEAGVRAGYLEDSPYAVLNSEKVVKEITKRTQEYIAINGPEAVGAMLNVMRDPSQLGAANKLNAAKEVLDRAGVVKADRIEIEHKGIDAAMLILPPKRDLEDKGTEINGTFTEK